jgi:hypothetical protein
LAAAFGGELAADFAGFGLVEGGSGEEAGHEWAR